jgi:hypothetical protein
LKAREALVRRQENTLIGDLREVAERRAPVRVCIAVVSGHGTS